MEPKSTTHIANQLRALVKFLPLLRAYLATVKVDFTDEPFASFVAGILKGYVTDVIGRRPKKVASLAELRAFGCNCGDCKGLQVFFADSTEQSISLYTGEHHESKLRHLEEMLSKSKAWGITWILDSNARLTVCGHLFRNPHMR